MRSSSASETSVIDFWNGNRSETRKIYEREVLEEVLVATKSDFGPWEIRESLTEYPGLEESTVFEEKGHHLFVTVAGNQKFKNRDVIMIPRPLAKNLLGYRIPIVRAEHSKKFDTIKTPEDLHKLRLGVPSDWSDATIFRHNGYQVIENGDFDNIFERQALGHFDYTTFGANEIIEIFRNRASKQKELIINEKIMLFYPFPLVFYVNPNMPNIAKRVDVGLNKLSESGILDRIFNKYYAEIVNELKMDQRHLFILENPLIPDLFSRLEPNLQHFQK